MNSQVLILPLLCQILKRVLINKQTDGSPRELNFYKAKIIAQHDSFPWIEFLGHIFF